MTMRSSWPGTPRCTRLWKFSSAGLFGASRETPSAIRTYPSGDGVYTQCLCGGTAAAAGALVANNRLAAAAAASKHLAMIFIGSPK